MLRGLDFAVAWEGKLEEVQPFDAEINFSLTLSYLNEDQEIESPEGERSIAKIPRDQFPEELAGMVEFLKGDATRGNEDRTMRRGGRAAAPPPPRPARPNGPASAVPPPPAPRPRTER